MKPSKKTEETSVKGGDDEDELETAEIVDPRDDQEEDDVGDDEQ